MPKMKSHRGAAKRFRKTGSGKVKRNKAYASHCLNHKSGTQKRILNQSTLVNHANEKKVKVLVPYS